MSTGDSREVGTVCAEQAERSDLDDVGILRDYTPMQFRELYVTLKSVIPQDQLWELLYECYKAHFSK